MKQLRIKKCLPGSDADPTPQIQGGFLLPNATIYDIQEVGFVGPKICITDEVYRSFISLMCIVKWATMFTP